MSATALPEFIPVFPRPLRLRAAWARSALAAWAGRSLAVDVPAFGKWMLTLAASILIIGAASAGTLNLVSQNLYRAPEATPRVTMAQSKSVPAIQIIAPIKARDPVPASSPVQQVRQTTTVATAEAGPPKMMATLSVAVRAQPAKASRQIGGLEQGQVATVTSARNGWMLVTTSTGVSGWVYGRYLQAVDPQIAADSPFWTE